jgi:hypothetical protein
VTRAKSLVGGNDPRWTISPAPLGLPRPERQSRRRRSPLTSCSRSCLRTATPFSKLWLNNGKTVTWNTSVYHS